MNLTEVQRNFHPGTWSTHSDISPQSITQRGEADTFGVDEHRKPTSASWPRPPWTASGHFNSLGPRWGQSECPFISHFSSPKPITPSNCEKKKKPNKHGTDNNWAALYNIPSQCFWKLVRSSKAREAWGLVTSAGDLARDSVWCQGCGVVSDGMLDRRKATWKKN